MDAPSATVAVISHERPHLRDQAVASVLASIARSGAQVPVVVIDSSRSHAPTIAGVRLVHRPADRTCVAKRRLAFELSDAEWVILLDDDCQAAPDAIGTMLTAMGSVEHRRTAALFVVTEFEGTRTRMFRAAIHSDLAAGFGETADVGEVAWGVTTLSAFRRPAVLAVDAFAERNLTVAVGGEDVDACIRLRNAGWQLHGLADVLALHDTATWSTFGQNARRSQNYGEAEAELVRTHPGHARLGYENLLVGTLPAMAWIRAVGGRRATGGSALFAGLLAWGAAELVELRARHREATPVELAVQAAWSYRYELGRLRRAVARRRPDLAVSRFNWECRQPTGFSITAPRGVSARFLTTGLIASAAAVLLRGRRRSA